jgi:GNAT superfamily N-acetyltransferase
MLLADLALARRLEVGVALGGLECVQTMMRLRPHSGAAVEKVAGAYALFAGSGSPLTHVLGLGMNGPVSATELEAIEAFYRSRAEAVQIDLCPFAHSSLLDLLGQRFYQLVEFNTVLVRPLLSTQLFRTCSTDIDVKEASPIDGRLWARTVASGFLENQEITPKTLDQVDTIFAMPSGTCFLAWINGEPAGGAAMSVCQGLVVLYADSTLPEFRNLGVHTALIQERCDRAIAAACDLAVAATLPGSISQRNYERAGFRPVYTKAILVREW